MDNKDYHEANQMTFRFPEDNTIWLEDDKFKLTPQQQDYMKA